MVTSDIGQVFVRRSVDLVYLKEQVLISQGLEIKFNGS